MLRTQELWRKYVRYCLAKAQKQKALISMRLEFDDFVKGRVVKIKDDHIVVIGYLDRKMKGIGWAKRPNVLGRTRQRLTRGYYRWDLNLSREARAERLEVFFSSITQLNLPPKLV